jgi:glutamyl-tRNA reductase
MAEGLRVADIVITSVNSPTYVVGPDDVQKVMRRRGNNPLFIIDIGVPRNVDPAARRIENVFLYDIDALSAIVDRNLQKRTAEMPAVTRIVREEMAEFLRWHKSLQVAPTIQDFRTTLETIRAEEVQKNINRFTPEDRELVEMLTRRIVNKILHQPLTTLKQGAENGSHGPDTLQRIKVLRELFGLTKNESHGD